MSKTQIPGFPEAPAPAANGKNPDGTTTAPAPAGADSSGVVSMPSVGASPSSGSGVTTPTPAGSNPGAAAYNPNGLTAPSNSAGLLSGSMPSVDKVAPTSIAGNAPQTTGASATGTNWNVDPATQTVQGQLTGILNSNSSLMQQAAARSREAQVANGTLNSSMAVGAAQGAVMDRATPIAQQDANTYAAAGKYAADTANTTSQFNTQQGNQIAVQNTAERAQAQRADQQTNLQGQVANMETQRAQSLASFDSATKLAMQNTDTAGKLQLTQIDSNTRQAISQIEAQYKVQMQTSNSMAMTYQSMIDSMTKVMADTTMDGPSKSTAIENLRQMYSDSLKVQSQVSGLRLGSIINPDTFGQVGGGVNSTAPAPAPAPGAPANVTDPAAPGYVQPATTT